MDNSSSIGPWAGGPGPIVVVKYKARRASQRPFESNYSGHFEEAGEVNNTLLCSYICRSAWRAAANNYS